MTCHSPFPHLNSFGEAFRANGYRIPGGDQAFIKEEPVQLGAPARKFLFPNTVMPSDIPGGSVVSFIYKTSLDFQPNNSASHVEFHGVDEFGLLVGGTLGKHWSFFGNAILYEGKDPGSLERLYAQWNPATWFNATIGMFEPRVVGPYSGHRNLLEINPFLITTFPIVPAQNFNTFDPSQQGVELWGGWNGPSDKGGLQWAFGVVNGNTGEGFDEAGGDLDQLVSDLDEAYKKNGGDFDINKDKDFYFRLSYKIGGMGVVGGGQSALTDTDSWKDNSITLGSFFYRGVNGALIGRGTPGNETGTFVDNADTFYRYGFDLNWYIGNFNILGGAAFFRDDVDKIGNFKAILYTAEVDWVVYPWLIPAVRYELVDPDYESTFGRFSLDLSLLPAANIKFLIGATFSNNAPSDLGMFADRYRLGLDIGF